MASDAPADGGGSGLGGDVLFFVGIILLFFIIWVAGGGPSRPISFAGPYLRPIQNTGQAAEAYGDRNTNAGFSSGISIGGWGGSVSAGSRSDQAAAGNVSPYAGKISLRKNAGVESSKAATEYLTIMVASSAKDPISTAGWTLASKKTGVSAVFPQGAETPQSGKINAATPIVLKGSDRVLIVTGRSPVGISFRENMCTGYFEERQDFTPPLSQSCPSPSKEYSDFYESDENECLSYVRTISHCETSTDADDDEISNSCEDFVEDYLNYNGCVKAHKDDDRFYDNSWRIYLGQTKELWKSADETILLLDAGGKVIDSLSY